MPQVMRLPAETYELRGSENIAGRLLEARKRLWLYVQSSGLSLIIGFQLRPLPSYLMQILALFENYIELA